MRQAMNRSPANVLVGAIAATDSKTADADAAYEGRIGANDIVNPDARTNPSSPIAGMPILDVDKSTSVIVIKRSLSPGFAGIPNPLFPGDNTLILFADGKQAGLDLTAAVKEND